MIEAEFGDGWIDLTAEQALTAVEAILRKASNPAREKEKFHKLNQLPGETGKAFVHRCEQQALECNMACPHCNKDISEWCIRDRVLAGLISDQLYQNIEKYPSLSSLVEKIEIFEAASAGCSQPVVAGLTEGGQPVEAADGEEASVAAIKSTHRGGKSTKPRQGYGRPNRAEPADRRREGQREVICYKCGGKGHRRAQCPSYAGSTTSHLASSVDEVDASRTTNSFSVHGVGGSSSKLAEVSLAVRPGVRTCARFCPAVADTGAEYCVAGTRQLKMLNLKLSDLSKADGKIRHAGGGALKILGIKKCTLQLAHKTTVQKVYFIQGVERFFLSVAACKDLGLVDKNFLYHTQHGAVTAGAMTGDHDIVSKSQLY